MPLEQYLLYGFFLLLSLFGAVFCLWAKRPLIGGMGLLVCLSGVAGIYSLLNSPFLALTQILIYVGGIIILVLFAILFTHQPEGLSKINLKENTQSWQKRFWSFLLPLIFFFCLYSAVAPFADTKVTADKLDEKWLNTTQELGVRLMTNNLLAFELIAILLLIVLIGVLWVAASTPSKP